MALNTLSFVDARRSGSPNQVQRDYLDVAIDGVPLRTLLDLGDVVSIFGWLEREHEGRMVRAVLLSEPSELPSGRVPLYICPECTDLGCGAVTVQIKRRGAEIVWSEFGHENNYLAGFGPIEPAREFHFDERSYRDAFGRFAWRRGGKRRR